MTFQNTYIQGDTKESGQNLRGYSQNKQVLGYD